MEDSKSAISSYLEIDPLVTISCSDMQFLVCMSYTIHHNVDGINR